MKQILLFASAIALMTSCAKQDTGTSNAVPNFEGVAFNAVAEGQGETKAEWTTEGEQWLMNWYAEQDKVSVFYKQALLSNTGYATTWSVGTASDIGAATYKATRTEKGGYFTADAATEILNWDLTQTTDATKAASFIVTWPAITAPSANTKVDAIPLTDNANQTQSDLNGSSTVKNVFMVTAPKALDDVAPVKNGSASDALIDMILTRPFPVAYFKLKNYDEDVFGALTEIKLTTEGSVAPAAVIPASKITFGTNASYDATKAPKEALKLGTTTPPASTITLTISATEWSDNDVAYMAISNVDRTAFATTPEKVTVEYTFADGTVTDEFTTSENWFGSAAGGKGFINMSNAGTAIDGAFDLNAVPYIYLNTNSVLIINESCKLSIAEIVAKESLTPGNITKLVAHVVLTQADFDYMGEKFTSCEDVTLMKNTEIPAFKVAANYGTLKSLVAPLLTTIDEGAFEKGTGAFELKVCALPSYKFDNVKVNAALLRPNDLEYLDASSCVKFSPVFTNQGVTLEGFSKLVGIIVMDGVEVGASAFKDCSDLENVYFKNGSPVGGAIKLTGASAFEGCENLDTISVDLAASSNKIPQSAFSGCKLLEVITDRDAKNFSPVTVDAGAFMNCEKLKTIDLSNAKTINANAFNGCAELNGSIILPAPYSPTQGVMRVGVAKLNEGVFTNCKKLKYLYFTECTEVANKAMGETTTAPDTELTQIEFVKAFKIAAETPDALSLGKISNTQLFVAGDQTGVQDGNKNIHLGNTGKTSTFTFKSIYKAN